MRNPDTLALALAAALSLCALDAAPAAAAPPPATDYADPAHWLCRPGRADVCAEPLTSTVVSPETGALTRKTYAPDPAAPVDCFYIYPTVSQTPAGNADLVAGPGEIRAATEQFARFADQCRPFAPLYRQTTVAAMRGQAKGDHQLAYGDVVAAWRWYLAHDNQGRGVVLIGHSQGASHLRRLIAEEIDGKPSQRLLVSALLLGGDVEVAPGADVGGDFKSIPLCRKADQTGCVIAYSTFLADHPPGPDAYFGKAEQPGRAVACVNPAALLGRQALDSELLAVPRVKAALGTTLVENPGLVSGACVTTGERTYLAISLKTTGTGAATLSRGLAERAEAAPGWGLHPMDVSLALGDLDEIVGRQAKAWLSARH